VRRADNHTTFRCRLSWNLGASTSWNPQGLSRPVVGFKKKYFVWMFWQTELRTVYVLYTYVTEVVFWQVTASANVWSLGVVLWEICEFGKLPYSDLNDDEVIVKVLGEGTMRLGLPSLSSPQRQNLYVSHCTILLLCELEILLYLKLSWNTLVLEVEMLLYLKLSWNTLVL